MVMRTYIYVYICVQNLTILLFFMNLFWVIFSENRHGFQLAIENIHPFVYIKQEK